MTLLTGMSLAGNLEILPMLVTRNTGSEGHKGSKSGLSYLPYVDLVSVPDQSPEKPKKIVSGWLTVLLHGLIQTRTTDANL